MCRYVITVRFSPPIYYYPHTPPRLLPPPPLSWSSSTSLGVAIAISRIHITLLFASDFATRGIVVFVGWLAWGGRIDGWMDGGSDGWSVGRQSFSGSIRILWNGENRTKDVVVADGHRHWSH